MSWAAPLRCAGRGRYTVRAGLSRSGAGRALTPGIKSRRGGTDNRWAMPTNPAPSSVVWIVDACRLSRKVACQTVEALGASVVCFENAPTAISEFSRVCMAGRKPDLVLVDL